MDFPTFRALYSSGHLAIPFLMSKSVFTLDNDLLRVRDPLIHFCMPQSVPSTVSRAELNVGRITHSSPFGGAEKEREPLLQNQETALDSTLALTGW